jgi:hypothetical protein
VVLVESVNIQLDKFTPARNWNEIVSSTAAVSVLGVNTNWPPAPRVTMWFAACAIEAPRTKMEANADFIAQQELV